MSPALSVGLRYIFGRGELSMIESRGRDPTIRSSLNVNGIPWRSKQVAPNATERDAEQRRIAHVDE